MAAWEIVTKADVQSFTRIPLVEMQDIWYEMAVGLIEEHTGWTLTAESNITEKVNGTGADFIQPSQIPISSVSSVTVLSSSLSSGFYKVNWHVIQLLSYRGDDITDYGGLYSITEFPYGIGNVTVVYDAGGYSSLPNKYLRAVQMCMFFLIKEISQNFRGEGSDARYKKYRPDRTQNPEEVLENYGQHGKMFGIMNRFLPKRKYYA